MDRRRQASAAAGGGMALVLVALGVWVRGQAQASQGVGAAAASGSAVAAASAEEPRREPAVEEKDLPPGGRLEGSKIFHMVRRGQTLAWLVERYLPLTEYGQRKELRRELVEQVGGRGLVPGQQVEIRRVRREREAGRPGKEARGELRGIYVTMASASGGRVFELVRALRPSGLNAVVIDLKDTDGIVTYPTAVPLAVETRSASKGLIRDLGALVRGLQGEGMYVIGRLALFKDRWIAKKAPALALQATNGDAFRERGAVAWVDPANEAVQGYNVALAREAAALGLDEVQLDYVRFPATDESASIAYSFDVKATPRHRVIAGFLSRMRGALSESGVTLSADIFGTVAWDEDRDVEMLGQRIEELCQHVDVLSPMLYPSHFHPGFHGRPYPAWEPYHFVYQGLVKAAEKAEGSGVLFRPWLQAFPYRVKNHYDARYILEQIRGAEEAGAGGFLLWDAENEYKIGGEALAAWSARKREGDAGF